jgi:hypothetical protein
MQASWFRSSPSFIVGVVLFLALGGVYLWRWGRPHPRAASDLIVREFVATAQGDVRAARRAIDRAADKVRSGTEVEAVLKAIDDAAAEGVKKVEEQADAALNRLEQLDSITLKTEQNRRTRIRNRLREMKEAIADAKKDATESVRTHAEERASQ